MSDQTVPDWRRLAHARILTAGFTVGAVSGPRVFDQTGRRMIRRMARRLLPIVIGAFVIELLWLIAWQLDPALIWHAVS